MGDIVRVLGVIRGRRLISFVMSAQLSSFRRRANPIWVLYVTFSTSRQLGKCLKAGTGASQNLIFTVFKALVLSNVSPSTFGRGPSQHGLSFKAATLASSGKCNAIRYTNPKWLQIRHRCGFLKSAYGVNPASLYFEVFD